MTRFVYRALDGAGRSHGGDIEAADISAAQTELLRRGLTPFRVREAAAERSPVFVRLDSERRLRSDELADLLGDLAALLSAHVPLTHALSVLSEASELKPVREVVGRAEEGLRAGRDLSELLSGVHDRASFLGGLIKVGQLSGDLGQAMRHASAIVRRDIEIRQNLWSTFSYPAFVFIALLAGLAVILGVVAPALAPLVAEIAPQKAWFLRLIVGASDWLATSWSVLLVILGGSIAALAASAALGMLGPALDRLLASGPLRRTVAELEYGAWAIGAGRLIATGAPAPQATLGASAFAKNNIVKSDIAHVAARMRDGASLARALAEATCVPPAIARMAQVGESAGALGPMLERGGEQAQARALRRIGRASAVAAPIALLLMGGLIGSIVAGLLTGVASIGDATLQ